jgi:hypothetical protein
MTETATDNRSVLREWASAFPELGKYGTRYVLRILGPVAVGIELFKEFPTTYRPQAVLMNLADIAYPRPLTVVHQDLRGKNRVQVAIPFDRHRLLLSTATQALREQAPIVVAPLPSLTDIIEWILRFVHDDMKGANTFQQYKAVMMLSKLLRDDKKGVKYFAAAAESLQEMPKWILEAETHGFDRWLEQLKATGPRQLMDNVHYNIERWKMAKLPSCGSLPDML